MFAEITEDEESSTPIRSSTASIKPVSHFRQVGEIAQIDQPGALARRYGSSASM